MRLALLIGALMWTHCSLAQADTALVLEGPDAAYPVRLNIVAVSTDCGELPGSPIQACILIEARRAESVLRDLQQRLIADGWIAAPDRRGWTVLVRADMPQCPDQIIYRPEGAIVVGVSIPEGSVLYRFRYVQDFVCTTGGFDLPESMVAAPGHQR